MSDSTTLKKFLIKFLKEDGFVEDKYTSKPSNFTCYKPIKDGFYLFCTTKIDQKRYFNTFLIVSKLFWVNKDYGSVGTLVIENALFASFQKFKGMEDVTYENWALDIDQFDTSELALDHFKNRYNLVKDRFIDATTTELTTNPLSQKRYIYLKNLADKFLQQQEKWLSMTDEDFVAFLKETYGEAYYKYNTNKYFEDYLLASKVSKDIRDINYGLGAFGIHYYDYGGMKMLNKLSYSIENFYRIVVYFCCELSLVEDDADINYIFRKVPTEPIDNGETGAYIFSTFMTFIEKASEKNGVK